jgi:hypothetical protein
MRRVGQRQAQTARQTKGPSDREVLKGFNGKPKRQNQEPLRLPGRRKEKNDLQTRAPLGPSSRTHIFPLSRRQETLRRYHQLDTVAKLVQARLAALDCFPGKLEESQACFLSGGLDDLQRSESGYEHRQNPGSSGASASVGLH